MKQEINDNKTQIQKKSIELKITVLRFGQNSSETY